MTYILQNVPVFPAWDRRSKQPPKPYFLKGEAPSIFGYDKDDVSTPYIKEAKVFTNKKEANQWAKKYGFDVIGGANGKNN